MLSRDTLLKILKDWDEWFQNVAANLEPRSKIPLLPKRNALGITGVRRAGKSYTAVQSVRDQGPVLYVNFEDPGFLSDPSVENLDEMISVYIENYGEKPNLLVLDEIQNIVGWEKWVRKMVELGRYKIVVTGSSSKMLSSELSTALAGRVIEKQVWPLSFSEYLFFAKRKPSDRDQWVADFRSYLEWGGFPQVTLTKSKTEKRDLLRQYLSDIVLKDIYHRHEIRSKRGIDTILNYYLTNVGCLHSYSSLKKAFGIGTETAAEYTGYFTEAFLIFEVSRYHPSLKAQARDPKKIYAIDTGMRNVCAANRDHDLGKLAENAVYLHLRRQSRQVFYFKGHGEVDFIVVEGLKPVMAIQVTYSDLREKKVYEREVGSLVECLSELKLKRGVILTLTRKEIIQVQGVQIRFVPLYELEGLE